MVHVVLQPDIATLTPSPASPGLFDSHVHLDAPAFNGDRERVLRAARAAGVTAMLIPAVSARTWAKLHALCESEPDLHPAYGLHPCYLSQHADDDLASLDDWLRTHHAVAVGECGLDHFDPALDGTRQLQLLRGQLEVAHRHDLPLVLHARRAFEAVLLELRRFGKPLRGVVHSFAGSAEQARQFRQLGFLVGIGGPVTYPRAHRLRRVVAELPIGSLLLETDAPDQPGVAQRGRRNEPAFLIDVLRCVAEARGDDPLEVASRTTANARRLFLPTE